MVLFEWFERFLVPVAAPDENYQPPPNDTSGGSLFWDTVAPDPNFTPPPPTSSSVAIRSQEGGRVVGRSTDDLKTPDNNEQLVECQYCHKMTPSSTPRRLDVAFATTSTPASSSVVAPTPTSTSSFRRSTAATPSMMTTPHTPHITSTPSSQLLDERLREAATSTVLLSSPGYQNKRKKVERLFKLLNEVTFYNDTKHDKLTKLIEKDPQVLLYGRVQKSDALPSIPEGYTPLQVAALQGNVRAVQLFLSAVPTSMAIQMVQLLNSKGETALHLACSYGREDVVTMLQKFYQEHGLDSQIHDLLGRTPLASGLTSPLGKKHASSLLKTLLSPQDVCIFGHIIPPGDRCYYCYTTNYGAAEGELGSTETSVVVGISEMPGRRAQMEDTTLVVVPESSSSSSLMAAVGVLDGHDDGGNCSKAAAQHLERLLLEQAHRNGTSTWNSDETSLVDVFQTVDDLLRQQVDDIPGGTTACVAIVTNQLIQVANVGDSRCLLIQSISTASQQQQSVISPPENSDTENLMAPLEESLQTLTLEEDKNNTFTVEKRSFVVKPLSYDHKPNLPNERARIEAAGLTVQSIEFEERGQPQVVHKVIRSMKSNMGQIDLATSRSLGDFEFKHSKEMSWDQQAVVAVPDIVTMERSHQDVLLVLACDGIWDVMTNAEVAQFVISQLIALNDEEHALAMVADRLCRKCFDLESSDNMSVALVALGATAERLTSATKSSSTATPTEGLARHLDFDSDPALSTPTVSEDVPFSSSI